MTKMERNFSAMIKRFKAEEKALAASEAGKALTKAGYVACVEQGGAYFISKDNSLLISRANAATSDCPHDDDAPTLLSDRVFVGRYEDERFCEGLRFESLTQFLLFTRIHADVQ